MIPIKQANGVVVMNGVGHAASKGLSSAPVMHQLLTILRSLVPYLLFLFFYGINNQVHILPRFTDIGCITLHNISAFENFVFHFHMHKVVSSVSHTATDVLSAIPYLMHYVIPILYPLYLFCKGRTDDICRFYWLLGWVMWAHYVIWFIWPTAPPWLYANMEKYRTLNTTIPPLSMQHKEGCAFARLDALTGIPFFFKMFAGNPVPFGSMPSGHVAWPTIIYVTLPPGGRIFALYILWVAWATLYSCHHYLSDAIAAVLLVLAVKKLVLYFSERNVRSRENICSFQGIVCPLHIV